MVVLKVRGPNKLENSFGYGYSAPIGLQEDDTLYRRQSRLIVFSGCLYYDKCTAQLLFQAA